jgi:gamma-glutamyl phosphate reductase
MADPEQRVLRHLTRAAEELALAAVLALQAFGARSRALAELHRALRAEERRWRARGATDLAAARVAELFAALADVFEPPPSDFEAERQAPQAHAARRRL